MIGAGPIGLLALQVLLLNGAGKVFIAGGKFYQAAHLEENLKAAVKEAEEKDKLLDQHPNMEAGPLYGVLGGFHLAGANEIAIAPTVEAMKPFALASIAAGHCTGWRAIGALAAAFGESVAPSSVGKTYRY